MKNEATVEPEVCSACRLVPVAHLSLDLPQPIVGWETWLEAEGIDVQVDDCGRPAISRLVFGSMIAAEVTRRKLEVEKMLLQRRKTDEAQRKARLVKREPAMAAPLEKRLGR